MKAKQPTILIKVAFWTHFFFALVSHLVLPLMFIGIIRLVLGFSNLDFFNSVLLLGSALFSLTYLFNHVTNTKNGFCCLTELENVYREMEGMKGVGPFVPRFWKKCIQITKKDYWSIPE